MCSLVEAGEKSKGNLPSNWHAALVRETVAFFDPNQKLIAPKWWGRVPALVAFLDACANCGCVYARRVELGQDSLW